MTLAIATRNTLEARATAWASKADDELRREATSAANARDPDRLWSLTEAFLATRSRGRTFTSPNTLKAYRRGILDPIAAWPHENLLRPTRNAPDLYVMKLMLADLAAPSRSSSAAPAPSTRRSAGPARRSSTRSRT